MLAYIAKAFDLFSRSQGVPTRIALFCPARAEIVLMHPGNGLHWTEENLAVV